MIHRRMSKMSIMVAVTAMSEVVALPSAQVHRSYCEAFQLPVHAHRHRDNRLPVRLSLASGGNAEEEKGGDEDRPSNGGEELAEQFYDQLRRRELSSLSSQTEDSNEMYELKDNNNKDPVPQPIRRKFTGASTSPSSLFSNKNNQQSQSTSASPNLQNEREREFNLASTFERTFGLQVALLVFSIVFISSVGLSGGITDGSERYFGGADDLLEDTVLEQLERVRTDDAAEAERMRMMGRDSQLVQGSQWL